MLGSKPISTHVVPPIKLFCDDSTAYHDTPSYRRLIGRLLYLTTTRPDITFITQQLCQFMNKPTTTHFNATTRFHQYLKHYLTQGLFFTRSYPLHVIGFFDVNCAGCVESRRLIF